MKNCGHETQPPNRRVQFSRITRSKLDTIRGTLPLAYQLEAMFGPGTKLTVRVRQPEMSHTVSVARMKSWLDGSGKSPGEHAMKSRLRGLVS
jgi:hypothetical protein